MPFVILMVLVKIVGETGLKMEVLLQKEAKDPLEEVDPLSQKAER